MALLGTRSLGMILLALWLILTGLGMLTPLPVPPVASAVLALAAGVLILAGR